MNTGPELFSAKPSRRPLIPERPFYICWGLCFPLLFWSQAYDSFHEPKWLLLSCWVGFLLLVRWWNAQPVLNPLSQLDPPLLGCLICFTLAFRWTAEDHQVAFMFLFRLVVAYLAYRLMFTWLLRQSAFERQRSIRILLASCLVGGVLVGLVAILQDWGFYHWSREPVSDWRFNLSSTLGNPNEVGGYLCYLTPIVLAGWFLGDRSSRWSGWITAIGGLLLVYALTTVFTVGAWLGLFIILPLSVLAGISRRTTKPDERRRRFTGWVRTRPEVVPATAASLGCFLILQGLLNENLPIQKSLFFLISAVVVITLASLAGYRLLHNASWWKIPAALTGLFLVWGFLMLPWGIPNHPEGLVSEALASPRWKGGFGARRFIWTTTALMIKDHPIRGIGWGRYYTVHALYQGELYRQRNLPHDRPTVGLVPQAHSDPLQVVAESGIAGGVAFFWLVGAVLRLWFQRLRQAQADPEMWGEHWIAGTGLCLIFFHCLVDFPLHQPQPVFLAVIYLALLSLPGPCHEWRIRFPPVLPAILGVLLILSSLAGLRDQQLLKRGFEQFLGSRMAGDADSEQKSLQASIRSLSAIQYPLPETHDRWIYLARARMMANDIPGAMSSLEMASHFRHSTALYEVWREIGQQLHNPSMMLAAVRGMERYNPCWAGFYDEEAQILRVLGKETEAKAAEEKANRFRVPPKGGP